MKFRPASTFCSPGLVGSAGRVSTRPSTISAQTAMVGIAQMQNFSMPLLRPRKTNQALSAKVTTQNHRLAWTPPSVSTPFDDAERHFAEVGLRGFDLRGHRCARVHADAAARVGKGVAQAPALDDHVVEVDHQRHQHAEGAHVARDRPLAPDAHDGRRRVESLAPAVAAHGPLGPADGDAQQQERDEVGDHEGAAAVGGGIAGKAQEVAQPDGRAGHRQDDAQAGAPLHLVVRLRHRSRVHAHLGWRG